MAKQFFCPECHHKSDFLSCNTNWIEVTEFTLDGVYEPASKLGETITGQYYYCPRCNKLIATSEEEVQQFID